MPLPLKKSVDRVVPITFASGRSSSQLTEMPQCHGCWDDDEHLKRQVACCDKLVSRSPNRSCQRTTEQSSTSRQARTRSIQSQGCQRTSARVIDPLTGRQAKVWLNISGSWGQFSIYRRFPHFKSPMLSDSMLITI
ncbi:hypothetical protein LIA77_08118 [Sarocladium implicatum]|nr:hypothetical protein LIA77_08118 [Sarocladium implicatum]